MEIKFATQGSGKFEGFNHTKKKPAVSTVGFLFYFRCKKITFQIVYPNLFF